MGAKHTKLDGIARIYKVNTCTHIMFGAIRLAKLENPDRELTEIVKVVLQAFAIEMTVEAGVREYNRTLKIFIESGGI